MDEAGSDPRAESGSPGKDGAEGFVFMCFYPLASSFNLGRRYVPTEEGQGLAEREISCLSGERNSEPRS